jgi:hypothetical protein
MPFRPKVSGPLQFDARVRSCPIVASKKRRLRFWTAIMEGEGYHGSAPASPP